MFEQERFESDQKSKSLFRSPDGPAAGMSRFRVSSPHDPAEIAAEQMADSVVGGGLFRSPEGAADAGGEADLSTMDLAGAGSPLPMGLQGSMEQSFGADFSGVRVHTGAGADRASRSISARAFTRGQDVYFRSGAYEPDSQQGQHLIAHELAHVAAGDGGIHRDDTEPDPKVENREREKRSLEIRTEISGKVVVAANNSVMGVESMQAIAQEIKGGTLGKADLESKKKKIDEAESGLEVYIPGLQELMDDYVQAEKELSSEDAAKESFVYTQAQKILDRMKDVAPQVNKAKENVEWGIEQAAMKENPATGSPFPATVDNMLSDPACGQFFKAVADVRKGTAGVEDLEAKNNDAFNSRAGAHLRGDVAESALDKVDRQVGKAEAVNGIASVGSDMLSGAADINEELAKQGKASENEQLGTISSGTGLVTGAVSAGTDTIGLVTGSKALHDQEAERKRKIQAMQAKNTAAGIDTGIGSAGAADHLARVGVAGQGFGAVSSLSGFGSSIADEKNNKKAGDVLGHISSFSGVTGDTLGLAADSQQAKEMRQKDMMAKKSIQALGKQLEGTIPAANRTGRSRLIGDVCERVKGKKFNATAKPDGTGGLAGMIDAAMAEGTGTAANGPGQEDPSKPELTSKQKNLLTSMKVLEASRMASKGAASDSRKDALFSTLGLIGSLAGLIGSFLKNKVIGAVVSMVGSLFGLPGAVRDAVGVAQDSEKKRQDARNKERDSKVAACQGAMMQMSALPPLSLEGLQTAKQEKLPLSAGQLEAAEQYAAVFNMIQSANVEMTDFLYAIEMGGFGGKNAGGTDRTVDQSLMAMYQNLTFTS
ncbi:eCIS core domain-containing protein [Candidatus Avoscillospira sp. LCP25S3_F1]|uniref:eCIS core domain-containing protein n=1 Tax=Candidatus Avoscillospira sp. LCP25S3_F1 TaxID=3438825 RepID=UPI003F907478